MNLPSPAFCTHIQVAQEGELRAVLSWSYSGSQLPVWQLCSQTRCPSYLQRHRIMLLEKSDSATSYLGFTATWMREEDN